MNHLSPSRLICLAVLSWATVLPTPAWSQRTDAPQSGSATAKPKSGKPEKATARDGGVTPAQEAAVRALVRQHHPDLEALLDALQRSHPSQYIQAVRSLFKTSVRLAGIQERDKEKYNLELTRWKLESQSQLLALKVNRAKGAVREPLLSELRATAVQLIDTRRQLLTLERDRLLERAEKLDEQVRTLTGMSPQQVDDSVQSLLRSARGKSSGPVREKPPATAPAKTAVQRGADPPGGT